MSQRRMTSTPRPGARRSIGWSARRSGSARWNCGSPSSIRRSAFRRRFRPSRARSSTISVSPGTTRARSSGTANRGRSIRVRTPLQTLGVSVRANLFGFAIARLDFSVPQERGGQGTLDVQSRADVLSLEGWAEGGRRPALRPFSLRPFRVPRSKLSFARATPIVLAVGLDPGAHAAASPSTCRWTDSPPRPAGPPRHPSCASRRAVGRPTLPSALARSVHLESRGQAPAGRAGRRRRRRAGAGLRARRQAQPDHARPRDPAGTDLPRAGPRRDARARQRTLRRGHRRTVTQMVRRAPVRFRSKLQGTPRQVYATMTGASSRGWATKPRCSRCSGSDQARCRPRCPASR